MLKASEVGFIGFSLKNSKCTNILGLPEKRHFPPGYYRSILRQIYRGPLMARFFEKYFRSSSDILFVTCILFFLFFIDFSCLKCSFFLLFFVAFLALGIACLEKIHLISFFFFFRRRLRTEYKFKDFI